MEISEIARIADQLRIRGLKSPLRARVRIYRPNASHDTVARAFRVTDYESATPLLKWIIQEGQKMICEDDERIKSLSAEAQAV